MVSSRPRLLAGRYEKRHGNIAAHVSPCFRVTEGDTVVIGQCRWGPPRCIGWLRPPAPWSRTWMCSSAVPVHVVR